MKIKSDFEIVNIDDDYMLVPVGDQIESFKGTVILNEVTAYLLEKMRVDRTIEELIKLLTSEYDVDEITAQRDLAELLNEMRKIGILDE